MFSIETERLRLRLFRPDDLADYQETVYGDADVMTYLPGGVPISIDRTEDLIDHFIRHHERHGFSIWAATDKRDDALVGHGGLIHISDSDNVELAYAFGKAHWGKGYATEVARASLHHGFEEIGLSRIVALAFPANLPSQRVMEKIGMTHRGLTDRFHGAELVMYEMTKADYRRTNRREKNEKR